MLFDRQYTLTQTVTVEVRYRPETRTGPDGPYTVQVPYNYYICNVTLDNADLSHLPVEFLDEDKLHMYATYMATYGNRPDLFPTGQYPNASERGDYMGYDVNPERLPANRRRSLDTDRAFYPVQRRQAEELPAHRPHPLGQDGRRRPPDRKSVV